MHTLGFTTVTFRNFSRRQICEIAVQNGIKGIEWGGDIHLPPDDLIARKEVILLQQEFGLRAVSYGSYYYLGTNDKKLWHQITDTAVAIGADIVRIWQGKTASNMISSEQYESMISETRSLADIAAQKGLTIAFEFHEGTNNDCGEASVRFLKTVNKENVKTYWQPLGKGQDLENLREVLPYLAAVHVFHWGKNLRRYSLQSGWRVWEKYTAIIREAELPINYILEFVKNDSPQQFAKDVHFMKQGLIGK